MSKHYFTHELFPWICFSAFATVAFAQPGRLRSCKPSCSHSRLLVLSERKPCPPVCEIPAYQTSLVRVAIHFCGRGGSGSDWTSGTLLGRTNTSKDSNRYPMQGRSRSSGQAGPAVSFGLCSACLCKSARQVM